MNNPTGLKYTKSDEWIKVDGNIGTVGITEYAQEQLSDVVFVEVTTSLGDSVRKGSAVATIESVKAAADVTSPVSGKLVEVNEQLPDSPEQVNTDPFGQAWMFKLELSDPAELDSLMDAAAYDAYLQERAH